MSLSLYLRWELTKHYSIHMTWDTHHEGTICPSCPDYSTQQQQHHTREFEWLSCHHGRWHVDTFQSFLTGWACLKCLFQLWIRLCHNSRQTMQCFFYAHVVHKVHTWGLYYEAGFGVIEIKRRYPEYVELASWYRLRADLKTIKTAGKLSKTNSQGIFHSIWKTWC